MPPRKKRGRPPTKRAATTIQRAWRRSRMMKARRKRQPLSQQSHTFVERGVTELVLTPNGSGVFQTFQLEDIYNRASYAALFEYYTINKVVVTYRYKADGNPRRDVISATTGVPNEANPLLYFKVDHNDDTADSLATMKASSRTRTFQFTNDKPELAIQIRPAVLNEVYKSTIASTYVPKWKQRLTTADLTVPHYGLKSYAIAPGAAQYGSITITMKYYFTMKNNE
jgi:hypothetical protein